MELIDFFRAMLPDAGHYCMFSVPRRRHVWVSNLDDLVTLANKVSESEAGWYFGTASFGDITNKSGQPVRTQDNVTGKKCFYIDIDAGDEKHFKDPEGTYASNAEAQLALGTFIRATGLVPSLIVHSGEGLQGHFILDQPATREEWEPVAEALGRFCKANDLRVDSSCTTDSARIFRALGALHKNGERVKLIRDTGKVYTPAKLRKLLNVEQDQFALAPATSRVKLKVNDQLNMFESAPSSAVKAAEKCMALKYIADKAGDVPEPIWRGMIGITKVAVEGAELAHAWSQGYPGYDAGETQAKFDRYSAGPTTCEYFRRHCTACTGCGEKVTSPIQLGRLNDKETAELPIEQVQVSQAVLDGTENPFKLVEFGEGFRVQFADGHWRLEGRKAVVTEDDDGNKTTEHVWLVLADSVLWAENWIKAGAADNDAALVKLSVFKDGQITQYPLTTTLLAVPADLRKWLYGRGVPYKSTDKSVDTLMHTYVNNQFHAARMRLPQVAIRHQFGMQFDGDSQDSQLVCAQGAYVIRADGQIQQATIGHSLVNDRRLLGISSMPPVSTAVWPADVWASHIFPRAHIQAEFLKKYYARPGYETAQLALMFALASPFIMFAADSPLSPELGLPRMGMTVSLYSASSGKGKTSLQRAAAACFGDPTSLVMSGGDGSTLLSRLKRAAQLGTFPLMLDEVTQNGPQEVARMIQRISDGHDKARLNRSAGMQVSANWSLVALMSTNIPQREMLSATAAGTASDALQMRLLELDCEFPPNEPGSHVTFESDMKSMLAANYGCLGAVINAAVVRGGHAFWLQEVSRLYEKVVNDTEGSTQQERFMQRAMACVLACQRVLTNAGMALFDTETLFQTFQQAVGDTRVHTKDSRPDSTGMWRRLISEFAPHIIRTREGVASGRTEPVDNLQLLRYPYHGRHILGDDVLYLSTRAIATWCQENGMSAISLRNNAYELGYLKPIGRNTDPTKSAEVTITKGTPLGMVKIPCLALDMAKVMGSRSHAPSNVLPLRGVAGDEAQSRPT